MFNSVNVNSCGEPSFKISDEKLEKCYTPNEYTYPLCKGQFGNCECKDCNVYENMLEGGF